MDPHQDSQSSSDGAASHELALEEKILKQNYFPSIKERSQAILMDVIILLIGGYFLVNLLDKVGLASGEARLGFLIFFVVYEPLLISAWGGTIGHKMMEIEIRRSFDPTKRITIFAGLFRLCIKYLLGWISLLTISGHRQKRAMHDLASGTIVLRKKMMDDPILRDYLASNNSKSAAKAAGAGENHITGLDERLQDF